MDRLKHLQRTKLYRSTFANFKILRAKCKCCVDTVSTRPKNMAFHFSKGKCHSLLVVDVHVGYDL